MQYYLLPKTVKETKNLSYNLDAILPFAKNSKGNKESANYIFGYVLLTLLQYNSGRDEILQ
jgi:hypothetical protein